MTTENTKYLRELTFGPSGTGKTKAHGEGYPTPMLVLNTDSGGPDSITTRKVLTMKSADFRAAIAAKQEAWGEVTVLDYTMQPTEITSTQFVMPDRRRMDDFIADVNCLTRGFMPFKTLVLDSWSGFDPMCLEYIWALNGQSIGTLSQYTQTYYGQLASKKYQVLGALLAMPCHVCVIAHSEMLKDELSGAIQIVPAGTGKLQQTMAKLFSQVLYATTEDGKDGRPKYVVWTVPKGMVTGPKLRWPQGKDPVIENSYRAIYG